MSPELMNGVSVCQCMGERQQHQADKQGSPACHVFQTGAGLVEVNYCSLGPQLEKSARQCFRDAPDLAAIHALIIFQTSGKSLSMVNPDSRCIALDESTLAIQEA